MVPSTSIPKHRARLNRTLVLTDAERARLRSRLATELPSQRLAKLPEGIAHGDFAQWVPFLPARSVDLLFLDPPYNLDKSFNGWKFSRKTESEYTLWLDRILQALAPLLRPTASVYICGDWRTSHSIFEAASRHLIIQSRITWEREKGRGARSNWKNACEDIWFCTVSDEYCFNVDAVKLRRRVLAPYTNGDGTPKDWRRTIEGDFRETHPSNLWTDISIPFWSMPENTDHPTQKSEKLLAKLVLASTHAGDFVLDPFVGSGTTAVVAKKLNRRCFGIEIDQEYCLLALRRMEIAKDDPTIQGYADGVFWERNTLARQLQSRRAATVAASRAADTGAPLFEQVRG